MTTWSWDWHPHPETWVLIAVAAVGYWYALTRIGPRHVPASEPVATRGQKWSFSIGLVSTLVAVEWPIHDLAERALYSVHMVQHLILTLVVPPLILAGIPAWMVRALLPARLIAVLRALCRPFVALVIFNVVIVFTHWPLMVDASVSSELAHFAQHALLVAASLIMWMPVLSPVLEIPRLSYPGQMVFLFLQSIVPTVPASFLTFGVRPLYKAYEEFGRPFGISALSDQRTAGLIMKLVGGAVLWGFITAIFFKWFKLESTEGVDALGYRDVDKTLNRMELVDR